VLWLLGDEVFHGEGGPPTVEESIYGPVRAIRAFPQPVTTALTKV
jgi:hypothetical protein